MGFVTVLNDILILNDDNIDYVCDNKMNALFVNIEIVKEKEIEKILSLARDKIAQDLNILSMTDITGFGLANHLLNLIKRDNNKSGLTIFPQKIPIFSGVKEAIDRNVKSSLFKSSAGSNGVSESSPGCSWSEFSSCKNSILHP